MTKKPTNPLQNPLHDEIMLWLAHLPQLFLKIVEKITDHSAKPASINDL
jgi:hypothetical protein